MKNIYLKIFTYTSHFRRKIFFCEYGFYLEFYSSGDISHGSVKKLLFKN